MNKLVNQNSLNKSKGSLLDISGLSSHDRKRTASSLSLSVGGKATAQNLAKNCAGGLVPLNQFKFDAEIFSVQFLGKYIACGLGNGTIRLYHIPSNSLQAELVRENAGKPYPCTSISGKPDETAARRGKETPTPSSHFKEENFQTLFLASYADGYVAQWHADSCKVVWHTLEKGNAINCVAYNHNGTLFATAGTDLSVRIYSEASKQLVHTLSNGNQQDTLGHSNRIFSVKWHPSNPNTIISGGWDNTIQVWNIKEEISTRSIYGPHLGGDGLCFLGSGEQFATASFTNEQPLQIWNANTGELETTISWTVKHDSKPSYLYSLQYSVLQKPPGKPKDLLDNLNPSASALLVAGGGSTESNDVKIFSLATRRCIALVTGFEGAVYSAALSPDCKLLAVGTASSDFNIYNFEKSNDIEFLY